MRFQKNAFIEGIVGRIIRTTMPVSMAGGDAEDDPRRRPEGAPAEGVEHFIQFMLMKVPGLGLHLTAISPEQLRQVVADRFEAAPEFVERVAAMMERGAKILPKFPITAPHLRSRLLRAKTLDEAAVVVQSFLQLLQQSAHLEWSDLTKMCDFVLKDVEAQIERPTLDVELRHQLSSISAAPMETWRSWLKGRQQTQAKNDGIRDEVRGEIEAKLAAALHRAEVAEAKLRALSTPAAPTPETGGPLPLATERRRNR